ncbi:hypothetical protein HAX54_046059, partial [Datura stramonium]|nr:hypothetical protein [Datura stramonium]
GDQDVNKGASSSAAKAGLSRRFKVKSVDPHGLTWFNTQKEVKYAPKNWIEEGYLALELMEIWDKIHELGVCYIFNESEKCHLTLVREFYENWDTSFGERTK